MIKHERQEPAWLQDAMAQLNARRAAKKQKKQQAAESRDIITSEKVMEHFNAAERAGTWSRAGLRLKQHRE